MTGTRDDDFTTRGLSDRMEALEARLEDLHGQIESCRQAMILSRVAIGGGAAIIILVFTIIPAYFTATVLLGAFTAMIGGVVWLGANKSTKDELEAKRTEGEAQRNTLFDTIAARNGWDKAPATYH